VAPTGATAPAPDGEDHIVVDRINTMDVARNHTLTLDGQAGNDLYEIFTTGSLGADRNYVINVLDTGASSAAVANPGAGLGTQQGGADVIAIYGNDNLDPAHNGVDANQNNKPVDDIFLLRRVTSIACAGPDCSNEGGALRPAFVALLHATVDQAKGAEGP